MSIKFKSNQGSRPTPEAAPAPAGDPLQERIQAILAEEMTKALATIGENSTETLVRQAVERVKHAMGALSPQALLAAAISRPSGPVRQLSERLQGYAGSEAFARLCNERIDLATTEILDPQGGNLSRALLMRIRERIADSVADSASSRAWHHLRMTHIAGGSSEILKDRLVAALGERTTLVEDLVRAYSSEETAKDLQDLRQATSQIRQSFPDPLAVNLINLDGGLIVNGSFYRVRYITLPPFFRDRAGDWNFHRLPIEEMTFDGMLHHSPNGLVDRSGNAFVHQRSHIVQMREHHVRYTPSYPADAYILYGPYAYPIYTIGMLTGACPWHSNLRVNSAFYPYLNKILTFATYIDNQHPLPGPWMWRLIFDLISDQETFITAWLKGDFRYMFHRSGNRQTSACFLDLYSGQVFSPPPANHRRDVAPCDINHYTRHDR